MKVLSLTGLFFSLPLVVGHSSLIGAPLPVATLNRATPVDFAQEIVPILKRNCVACHNTTKSKAGLNLETPSLMKKGGDSGPAIIEGKSEESLLFKTAGHIEDPVMPPPGNKSNAIDLTPEELALMKLWIDQGAKGEANVAAIAPLVWRDFPAGTPVTAVAVSVSGSTMAYARGNRVAITNLSTGAVVGFLQDPSLGPLPIADRDAVQSLSFYGEGLIATGGYRTVKIWSGPVLPTPNSVILATAEKQAQSAKQRWEELKKKQAAATEAHKNESAASKKTAATLEKARLAHLAAPTDATEKTLNAARQDAESSLKHATAAAQDLTAAEIAASAAETVVTEAEAALESAKKAPASPEFCGPLPPWKLVRTIGSIDDPKIIADRVTALGFSPDGRTIAVGGGEPSRHGEVKLFSPLSGGLLSELKDSHSDTVLTVQFSPDGESLATGGADRLAKVWRVLDGSKLATLEGHSSHVLSLAWRADGLSLATASGDKTIRHWDVTGRRQTKVVSNFDKEVSAIAFLGAGDTVVSASGDQSVRLGDERLPGSTGGFLSAASIDPLGRWLAAGGADGAVRVWTVSEKKMVREFR